MAETIARLDSRTVRAILASDTNAQALLAVLVSAETIVLFAKTDPLAGARLRGLQRRDELLGAEGGTLSGSEVAGLLHLSRQALEKRRRVGRLLAIDIGRRGYRYPAWQCDETGSLHGLERVLEKLADVPPVAVVRFFLGGAHALGGDRPLDRLRNGRLASVLEEAERFGLQGAA